MVLLNSSNAFKQLVKLIRNFSYKNIAQPIKPNLRDKITLELFRRFKPRKKKLIKKKLSDDVESIWLDSLDSSNIKLYRRTSFGSFKIVNMNNLLNKLKVIYPQIMEEIKDCPKQLSKNTESSEDKLESHYKLASPAASDFFLYNLTSFPLLKSTYNESLQGMLKEESENYGLVDSVKFPSVTKILSNTMSDQARQRLLNWKNKMIEKLGEEGFYNHQKDPVFLSPIKTFIRTPRKQKQIIVDILNQGVKFHGSLKKYLESGDEKSVTIDPDIEGCWKSLEKLLPDISKALLIEDSVHHPMLMYKGVVDCVAHYRDVPCVIEWKKSDKKKRDLLDTYDAPLQLCAYLGALSWKKTTWKVTPKSGLVVVAYTNGDPANAFFMDLECCELYWMQWLQRLQTYWSTKTSIEVEPEV